jgi:hypothetical protein
MTEADEEQPGKMSKTEEAHSEAHMRTHKPFNPYCAVCNRAKSRNKKGHKNAFKRDIDHFGQIITLDHTNLLDKEFEPGVFKAKDCLEIMDLHTRFAYGYPVKTKEVEETEKCLRDFCGDAVIDRVYSDGHYSIQGAVDNMKIPIELSQPGVPRNNCIIENRVGDELRGLRSQLLQAGFPLCLWPYAARTYSTLENVRLRADGTCPWVARFETEPDFTQIPLGCLVWFIPAPTKYEVSPAAPRLMPGIFMGYRMAPGGKFGGEYIIVDLSDFKGISLALTARHTKFRFHEHFVQQIGRASCRERVSTRV